MDRRIRVLPVAGCVAAIADSWAARGTGGQRGIAGWGRDYGRPRSGRLSFTRGAGPRPATLRRLVAGVAHTAVDAAPRARRRVRTMSARSSSG